MSFGEKISNLFGFKKPETKKPSTDERINAQIKQESAVSAEGKPGLKKIYNRTKEQIAEDVIDETNRNSDIKIEK